MDTRLLELTREVEDLHDEQDRLRARLADEQRHNAEQANEMEELSAETLGLRVALDTWRELGEELRRIQELLVILASVDPTDPEELCQVVRSIRGF